MSTTPQFPTTQDCSLNFCTISCPQWCYFIFPPPPPSHHHPSSFSLSPLLIALIILLSSSFLILATYLFALKHFSRTRRPPSFPANPIHLPPPPTPLSPSLINKLTTSLHHSSAGDTACPVCLADFLDGETIRLLPKCAHAFHRGCIDTWLSSHSNCPLCRAGILPLVEVMEPEMEEVVIEIVEEGQEVLMEPAESPAGRSLGEVKVCSVSSEGGSGGGVAPL